ncbi:GNAT family N-acetyltransferase [Alkalibacillus haloalkaliphilus]|uniref:GNAT family N-acetyltransferase n=1 Tax=Alkalibacillus haloalkaliphilus TaxID=94136 RepID=UPI0029365780|nr:GNAT family N-acetyltransferase [Alkalibacillus haloalkaliphilus]MDV2581789.1 GNAT family N-acetyltransferase [Alkalibacillus haloalkaliphilus]
MDVSRIIIREGLTKDAEVTLEIQKEVIKEKDFLVTAEEEFVRSVEDHNKWIEKLLDNECETFLVAEAGGQVVGWLAFQSPNRKRVMHTGSVGMMVDLRFRGKGVGRTLLASLLEWAKQNPTIEKVNLAVFSSNVKAIDLYKKFGFEEEGRKVKEIKFENGHYVDDLLMTKFV